VRTPRQILAEATTIAVVGASRESDKPSYTVPLQLQRYGWRVIPVNPYADQIWGERCYRTLAEIPEDLRRRIDLVNVFRPSEQAAAVVEQAIEIGAPAVWLQQDIVSAEGRRMAEAAGIDYVENYCTAVERALSQLSCDPAA
jgi:predicted CoA-binding protein